MGLPTYESLDDLAKTLAAELQVGTDTAQRLARELDAEASHDLGDADELYQSMKDGAGMIADVGVDILSGVDVPAIDSQMLTLKSNGNGVWGGERQVLLRKDDDTERRISSAAAMIPREPDKEGETVSTPTVEQAAHDYLKGLQDNDGTGVDTDHNLIDDKGHVVESRILREDREFDLPDGGTKTHKAGSWLVDIEWAAEPWERVKAGDIEGISIYGTAEQVPIERSEDLTKEFVVPFADESVVQVLYASRAVAAKAARRMGFDGEDDAITHEHEYDGDPHYMPAPSHEEYVEAYNDFAESEEFGPVDEDGETVAASATVAKGEFSEGEAVYWDWQGDRVHGRIAEEREESATVDGVTITGDDDEPVYLIDEYDEEVDALRRENVAKPESSLNESSREIPDRSEENYASSASAKQAVTWEGYEKVGTRIDEFGNEVPRMVPKSAAKRLRKQDND
jgi:hypothetical protein